MGNANGTSKKKKNIDGPDGEGEMILRGDDGEEKVKIRRQEDMPKTPITTVVFEAEYLLEKGVGGKGVVWLLRSDGVRTVVYSKTTLSEAEIAQGVEDLGMKKVKVGDAGKQTIVKLAKRETNFFNGIRNGVEDIVVGLKSSGETVLFLGGRSHSSFEARAIAKADVGVTWKRSSESTDRCRKVSDWVLHVRDVKEGARSVVNALRIMQPDANEEEVVERSATLSPAVRNAASRSRRRQTKASKKRGSGSGRRRRRRRVTIEDALRVSP